MMLEKLDIIALGSRALRQGTTLAQSAITFFEMLCGCALRDCKARSRAKGSTVLLTKGHALEEVYNDDLLARLQNTLAIGDYIYNIGILGLPDSLIKK